MLHLDKKTYDLVKDIKFSKYFSSRNGIGENLGALFRGIEIALNKPLPTPRQNNNYKGYTFYTENSKSIGGSKMRVSVERLDATVQHWGYPDWQEFAKIHDIEFSVFSSVEKLWAKNIQAKTVEKVTTEEPTAATGITIMIKSHEEEAHRFSKQNAGWKPTAAHYIEVAFRREDGKRSQLGKIKVIDDLQLDIKFKSLSNRLNKLDPKSGKAEYQKELKDWLNENRRSGMDIN